MHHKKTSIILFFLVLSFFTASSQKKTVDTIALAKKWIDKENYADANDLLFAYTVTHPKELNGLWLYARTSFWLKNFTKAKETYKTAMALYPDNYFVKLDYAKSLVNMGDYAEAEPLLLQYLSYQPESTETLFYLAQLNYWKGFYKESNKWIDKVLQYNPTHEWALKIRKDMAYLQAPQLEITSGYYTDDQPLKNFTNSITFGKHFNSAFSPSLQITNQQINVADTNNRVNQLMLQNRFNLADLGASITIQAGAIQAAGKTNFIGSLEATKQLGKWVSLTAMAQRFQYLNTTRSITRNVQANKYGLSLNYNNAHYATAKLGFETNGFEDGNHVDAMYAWVLGPHIRTGVFDFRIGYAFYNGTSSKNLFVPQKTVQEIIATGTSNNISGFYDPYFTPANQTIHSVLANMQAQVSKDFSLSISSNIGVMATIDNPYFFLDAGSTGVVISKGFYNDKYFPFQINAQAGLKVNAKINLQVNYTYNKGFFFTSNQGSIGCKINLYNEGKRQ